MNFLEASVFKFTASDSFLLLIQLIMGFSFAQVSSSLFKQQLKSPFPPVRALLHLLSGCSVRSKDRRGVLWLFGELQMENLGL